MISWFMIVSVGSLCADWTTDDGGQTTENYGRRVSFFVLCRPSSVLCLFRRLGGARARGLLILLRIVKVDVETERTHFLDQHVEAFRNARLERVVAAHNRLIDLGAAGDVVRFHGQHLLQGIGGTIGF